MFGIRLPRWIAPLIAAVAVLLCAAAVQACPTCKENLANDANSAGLVNGFFWSILFMLSVPALLALGWAIYLVYHLSKAEEEFERQQALAARKVVKATDVEEVSEPIVEEHRVPVDVA